MKFFQKIAEGVDIVPLLHAVTRQPELWNQQRFRTTYTGTPHGDVDDIWLRFSSPRETTNPDDISLVIDDNTPVWYPAAQALPQAKLIVTNLMRRVEGFELGRLIISRLAPGKRILPHADVAGSYVNEVDRARYHVVLQGLEGSLFRCGNETVCMRSGEIWWFDAHAEHEVINRSTDDRIHLLVDLRLYP